MNWFFEALFFAFWTSINVLAVKKLTKVLSIRTFLFWSILFLLPFEFILAYLNGGIPRIAPNFFPLIISSGILDSIAFFSSTYSIQLAAISLLSPLSAFNPIFTLIVSEIALREFPTALQFLGIIIIVLGSYVLNLGDTKNGFFKPLTKLFQNRGVQLFLLANLLWGLTPIFQKQAIQQTTPKSPIFTLFFSSFTVLVLITPICIKVVKKS